MGITVGIDLGTTNSVVGLKKIEVSILRNVEGEVLTPSCVTAIPGSEKGSFDFVVGRPSRDLLKQYPEQTVTSVKRLMGRDFEDVEVQSLIKDQRASYAITTDASEPGSIRIALGGKMQTPEMISGIILKKLIGDGEAELQGKIVQAVVTVPAYFSDRQKFSTRAACDYANIKLLRLLPEPTAAALSFGLEELGEDASRTMMVFDLGGGTFDISVLSFAGGSFMEVTKGGDMWLGGDNIDKLLVNHIFASAEKTAHCKPIVELLEKLSPADKARFNAEIKEKAEAAKVKLSSEASATVEMFGLLKDEKNDLIDIEVTINRAEFAKLLAPIVKRVSDMAKQILHEIRFEPELIDTVLMVGGSSLVPAIQDELRAVFGVEKVMVHPRPMLAIAEGAALMAAKMISKETDKKHFSMMHSTAHDYYLQLTNGKKHLLVARNTPLPIVVEEKLKFSNKNQVLARLRVFNEVEGVLDTVGELWFHKEDAYAMHSAPEDDEATELMLRFSVNEDNIITMKAWSLKNEELSIEACIARGGLSAKLYNDLECTLSSIIADSDRGSVEDDLLRLSRSVVASILSASDPITGETRLEQKQKAQQQIDTLKHCQKNNVVPLREYKFALKVLEQGAAIFSHAEKKCLEHMIEELKQALENLDDVQKFVTIEKELDAFYEDVPTALVLAKAKDAALYIDTFHLGDGKQLRNLAKTLVTLHKHQSEEQTESMRYTILEFIDSRLSWSDNPTRRFDRDVSL